VRYLLIGSKLIVGVDVLVGVGVGGTGVLVGGNGVLVDVGGSSVGVGVDVVATTTDGAGAVVAEGLALQPEIIKPSARINIANVMLFIIIILPRCHGRSRLSLSGKPAQAKPPDKKVDLGKN